MFTEEELYSLLEEAFEEGYNSALEEVLDESSEEVDTEYPELFSESSKNVRRQMDNLKQKEEKSYLGNKTLWKTYYSKNPKRDWTKFTDGPKGSYTVFTSDDHNGDTVRGRIKRGENKSDDPRSRRLKEKVAANKERYVDWMKGRLRPFKDNRGNNYDD